MISRDLQPAPSLREYVYRYRLRHFCFDGSMTPSTKPFPPRPEQCLIFYPRGSERIEHTQSGDVVTTGAAMLAGQYTQRINRFITSTEFLMISVEFRPGALYRFTGLNLAELTNTYVEAAALLPGLAAVNSRLSGAATYQEMIDIIETYLNELALRSARPVIAVDHALGDLVNLEDIPTVDKLSRNAYMGSRQLERRLNERIGVCPKTFLKLSRFHRSLVLRLASPQLNWTAIALECGYTDYQHLAKDYKTYTLNTPNLFLQEEFSSPGRVLGLSNGGQFL